MPRHRAGCDHLQRSHQASSTSRPGSYYERCSAMLSCRVCLLPPGYLGLWLWPWLLCLDDHPSVGPAVIVKGLVTSPLLFVVLLLYLQGVGGVLSRNRLLAQMMDIDLGCCYS